MIKITLNKTTNTIVVGNQIFDTDITVHKTVTVFGIKIWQRDATVGGDIKQSVLETRRIGYNTRQLNEKTEEN